MTTKFPHVPPSGVWCPAITFFTPDGSDTLDLAAQRTYFTHLSKTGLAGLVIQGSNSEAFLLTREERSQLIATARSAVGPSFPLMAGVGAHSTAQTLELARDAAEAGANYLLILPPAYFAKATSMAVVKRFFAEVARKSPLPVVVYNFPAVCGGVDIDSDTISAMVRESASVPENGGRSKIVGVKLTCGSVGKITRLAATHPADEFATFGGQSDFLIGGLAAGSAGCIAAFANVCPGLVSEVYRLYVAGETAKAMELQRVAALAESPCKAGIAAVKYAAAVTTAKLAGIEDAERKLRPRHPYDTELPETTRKGIVEGVAKAYELDVELWKASTS